MSGPPPIFVLAPPRSFTSLINAMLGQHPECFGLPELMLFNVEYLGELWEEVTDEVGADSNRRHGLLRTVAELYAGEQTSASIELANHWAVRRKDRAASEIYREIRDRVAPLRIVEKSPAYTIEIRRMERMYETFPDARFIHLVRHPIPQCNSVMNLNHGVFALFVNSIEYGEEEARIEPQIAWHDLNINILRFLDQVPKEQHMRLRGELLMERPREHLAEICRWLGIRDDAEAVDQMMHPERSPFACFGPVDALFGNDPNFLRRATFEPHTPKVPPLDDPVPWREDGRGLFPEVIELARAFGYR
ncbi:sulfotransferase [Myxococcota bacterium]|nr:sulfotransferase [Myxococcota bacterium]